VPERQGDFIYTFTGRRFWPMDPRAEDMCIEDIAHALSMLCRYNGHVDRFYSVAEHSMLVYHAVSWIRPGEPALHLQALLHDASEAYLADVPRPVKPYLSNYRTAEREVERAIANAFGLPSIGKASPIGAIDHDIIGDEMLALMPFAAKTMGITEAWLHVPIRCLQPSDAEDMFLTTFRAIRISQVNGKAATLAKGE